MAPRPAPAVLACARFSRPLLPPLADDTRRQAGVARVAVRRESRHPLPGQPQHTQQGYSAGWFRSVTQHTHTPFTPPPPGNWRGTNISILSTQAFIIWFRCVSQLRAEGGGGAGGPWPPGASLGGGAGPACRGEF